MGLIRKTMSIGTLGTVGWNGQRATRAKNQKAQANLAKSEVGAAKLVAEAEADAAKRIARAQEKVLKAEAKAVRQAATAPVATPAGWHRDPHGRHEMRYWDGARWTQHVSDRGTVAIDLA